MTTTTTEPRHRTGAPARDPLRVPLVLFGVGLGGFVDGIVLHQILQWHHMISDNDGTPVTTVAGLEANTLADGLFHLFAFVVVVVALALLVRRERTVGVTLPPLAAVTGWLLVGWGGFNIVEGLVDHHLLQVHHVRDDVADPLGWDIGFLAISVVLVIAGRLLARRSERA